MDEAGVLRELVSQFGTAGLIIAYLVWDRWTTGKERRDLDKQQIDSNIRLAETLAAGGVQPAAYHVANAMKVVLPPRLAL